MNMKEMIGYEAPQVEIVEVEVEKGFAVTGSEANGSNPEESIPTIGV